MDDTMITRLKVLYICAFTSVHAYVHFYPVSVDVCLCVCVFFL